MSDDLVSIVQELREINKKLSHSYKEMWQQSQEYGISERDYKMALHQEILKLKSEGYPATLILELAKGTEKVADLRFKRDISCRRYESAKEIVRSLRTMASVWQSILKVQDEV